MLYNIALSSFNTLSCLDHTFMLYNITLSMPHSILTGWLRGPPLCCRAASAEHDAKNWEVHWYPPTSADKAKRKSLPRMPTAEKAVKERECTRMPVAKKERTGHKCPWQRKKDPTKNDGGKRKIAALIRQANSWHQMKETKQLKPPQRPKRWPTRKHMVGTKHHQITSLIDYCLQQMSGRLQSKP